MHSALLLSMGLGRVFLKGDNNGYIVLHVQMRKLGLRDIKWLAKIHRTTGHRIKTKTPRHFIALINT